MRTNEFALGTFPWELREFRLAASGMLAPAPVALTPDIWFNNQAALGNFMVNNQTAIRAGTHEAALASFLGGSAPVPGNNTSFRWTAGGVPEDVRAIISKGTCNGCHTGETQTTFLHINPLSKPASLSAFVTGTEIPRRRTNLANLVCTPSSPPASPPDPCLSCPAGTSCRCGEDFCIGNNQACP